MKEENNNRCDPCEEQFEEGVKEIVDQVEGYTPEEHREKEREVEAAFPTDGGQK